MTDWVRWHDEYDCKGSRLSRRLEVVSDRLVTALHRAGPSPVILSLCAGDGRDVIGVLSKGSFRVKRAVLVENDPALAERATVASEANNLDRVEIRCRDAGALSSFADVLPVDVLLLCGVFGNIDPQSVKSVVERVPDLVRNGGFVIWTRGGSKPDRRPEIRNWFIGAGMQEMAFDGDPEPFGVGFNRVLDSTRARGLVPERLFSFR